MNSVTINGKPGIRINGILKKQVSEKSATFNCDGDVVLLPLSQVTIETKTHTIILPVWLYNEKFEK
jgi:hypothetical protein